MNRKWHILSLVTCLIFLISDNVISGLKCFSCFYDDEERHSSSKECKDQSPSIRYIKECNPPLNDQGMALCSNQTLMEGKHLISVTRACVEFPDKGKALKLLGTCALDKSDGFLTCYCDTDACNVEVYDPNKNDPVEIPKYLEDEDGSGKKMGRNGVYDALRSTSLVTYFHLMLIVNFALFI